MKVTVYCSSCEEVDELYELRTIGGLIFNPETKSQTQHYECPSCGYQVAVLIEVTKDDLAGAKENF